jgi:hypothetical protein
MRRGGLFLKYAVPLVLLVSGALVVSALVEIYFSYRENKAALSQIQREKALAAAARIEQFVRELEHQLAWIAQTPWGARGVSLDQRRLDSLRLLRHAPAVTEVSHYDPTYLDPRADVLFHQDAAEVLPCLVDEVLRERQT